MGHKLPDRMRSPSDKAIITHNPPPPPPPTPLSDQAVMALPYTEVMTPDHTHTHRLCSVASVVEARVQSDGAGHLALTVPGSWSTAAPLTPSSSHLLLCPRLSVLRLADMGSDDVM